MGLRQSLASLFRRTPSGTQGRRDREPGGQEFAVIGLGVYGRSAALRLSELGFTVLGIDRNATVVQSLADDLHAALVLDAADEEALRQADLESYDTAIVAIGGDHFEATALATIALAKIGVPRIVAIADSPRQVEILQAIGATRVLNPVEESAIALADELTDPGRGDAWSITPALEVAVLPLPPGLTDHPVGDTTRWGIEILLVARGDSVSPHPEASFILRADDLLLVSGPPRRVLEFRRIL
jgi:trk system potassium uptake protein TrkA